MCCRGLSPHLGSCWQAESKDWDGALSLQGRDETKVSAVASAEWYVVSFSVVHGASSAGKKRVLDFREKIRIFLRKRANSRKRRKKKGRGVAQPPQPMQHLRRLSARSRGGSQSASRRGQQSQPLTLGTRPPAQQQSEKDTFDTGTCLGKG